MLICHYFDQCRKPTLNQMVKPKIPRESGLDIRNNPNFHPTKTRKSKTFKTEWHEQKRCSVSSCFTILPQMLERSALPRTGVLKKTGASHHFKALFFLDITQKKHEKNHPTWIHPKIMKVYLKNLRVQTVSRNSTWILQEISRHQNCRKQEKLGVRDVSWRRGTGQFQRLCISNNKIPADPPQRKSVEEVI